MTNNIKAGDRVQHKTWKGDVSTRGHEVACVTKVLGEPHAILEGGSAWPCSELVKMPPSDATGAQKAPVKADWWIIASDAEDAIREAKNHDSVPMRRMKLIGAIASLKDALDALPPANEIHVEGK